MDRRDFRNRFNFNDYPVFHDQVHPKPDVEAHGFVKQPALAAAGLW